MLYIFVLTAASYIFYRRFPNNYHEPNFYAEDGSVFARSLFQKGFLSSLTTTFNGYYLWGLYCLEQVAIIINKVFYEGEFVNLAKSLAITSYLALGFLATLPLLLFRKYFRPPFIILFILLGLAVPMVGWDYAIIGTIGNLKFAFVHLAFLLLVYRHLMPKDSRSVLLVDLGLLICAYTNITVYTMIPFALLRYLPLLKDRRSIVQELQGDFTFRSLIVLGVALLPQLYVVKRDGVPVISGYLDSAYQPDRTTEIFVGRTYLYTVLFPIYKSLNDMWVWLIFGLITLLTWFYTGKHRKFALFGLFSALMATLLFVVKRTGVSEFFIGYENGGPDQFFYPQNLIFGFILALLITSLVSRIPRKPIRLLSYLAITIYVLFGMLPNASTYGKNNFMADGSGNIYANSKKACASNDQSLSIVIYPTKDLQYKSIDRQVLCSEDALLYQPEFQKLGLAPYDNSIVSDLGTKTSFTQTFVARGRDLDGLRVYFSTFLKKVTSAYDLVLYTDNCRDKILNTPINTNKIKDNSYQLIQFPVQHDSENKTYCFTITATDQTPQPLALQLSASGLYPEGQTIINQEPSERDVVFELHYKN